MADQQEAATVSSEDLMKLIEHIEEPMAQSGLDPQLFRQVAARLVGEGGECMVCGRVLERVIEHLYHEQTMEEQAASSAGRALAQRRWGFGEAYGSSTIPPRSGRTL